MAGAGPKATVKVTGLKELRKDLRQLEDKADRKGLQQELKNEFRIAARIVEIDAKSNVPKLSGKLGATIRPKGMVKGAAVMAGGVGGVRWAGPVEFGWTTRPNKAKGWRGGPIKARSYLRKALYSNKDTIRDVMAQAVQRIAEQVKGRTNG